MESVPLFSLFSLFSLFDIVMMALALVCLCIAVYEDRRGHPNTKWISFVLITIFGLAIYWDHWTFKTLYQDFVTMISSPQTYINIGIYVGIGLVYSIGYEFFAITRSTRQNVKERWDELLKAESITSSDFSDEGIELTHRLVVNPRELLSKRNEDLTSREFLIKKSILKEFAMRRCTKFFKFTVDADNEIQTSINKSELSSFVGATATFWPFYLVVSLVGDFIIGFFEHISNMFVNIAGRFIKNYFSSIFKL